MRYAVIEDGAVANVIILYPGGAKSFQGAVPCGDVPVAIGDTYDGEHFFRDGVQVLTPLEQARKDAEDMAEALKLLGINGETEAGQ